ASKYMIATTSHMPTEMARAERNSPRVETMRKPWLNSRMRSEAAWAEFAEMGRSRRAARAATRWPAKRRERAKIARKRVAARERMPARAKASWCGMLRGAKARVVEKRMAAEARS